MTNSKVVIVAGGTGGHIIPALVIADHLVDNKINAYVYHDQRVKEIVENPSYHDLHTKCLTYYRHRKSILQKLLWTIFLIKNIILYFGSFIIHRPKAVIGFGGYVTFPALLSARLLGIPIVIFEQNSIMGRVNRIFAKSARYIFTMFEDIRNTPKSCKSKIMPYAMFKRTIKHKDSSHKSSAADKSISLTTFQRQQKTDDDKINILITGGSQGSAIFSEVIPESLLGLSKEIRARLNVIFQAKDSYIEITSSKLASAKLHDFTVSDFIHDFPTYLAQADLVIARAGAATINELCTYGKFAILIPLANSLDNHQYHNALHLDKNKCALMVEERNFLPKNFTQVLAEALDTIASGKSKNFEERIHKLYKPTNLNNIIKLIEKI